MGTFCGRWASSSVSSLLELLALLAWQINSVHSLINIVGVVLYFDDLFWPSAALKQDVVTTKTHSQVDRGAVILLLDLLVHLVVDDQ